MSATFKNAKKKLSQAALRKYMSEHKTKDKDVKKVESPLAKYNDQGLLTCILCKSIVRSEAVWSVHVNAKQHKQNVELAKKLKERTNNFTTPLKRPLTPPLVDVSEKKIKGILKNTNHKENNDSADKSTSNNIPADFFDNRLLLNNTQDAADSQQESKEKETLPEGFFDDPKLDAKARNQEYKDPIEEEWEKFMKVIKEADNESNAIISEDQDEATTERQIDEIDDQMNKLSRVLHFEKKKEEIKSINLDTKGITHVEDEDVNEDFDEYLDWRSKKSFK